MNIWQKIGIGAGSAAVLGAAAWIAIWQINKDVVKVQTGAAVRQDLTSVVTASGEIKPLTYTNVLGEGIGKITEIAVKEGQHVKKGDVLLRLESIQPSADVAAQMAGIQSADAGVKSAQANDASTQADIQAKSADLEHAKLEWERGQQLLQGRFDPQAGLRFSQGRLRRRGCSAGCGHGARRAGPRGTFSGAFFHTQNRAMLDRLRDVLRKTTYTAPIGGIVTYIAIRVGENVVPGIQNATGSYLLTISDMSVVTSEVMVDETDIANVKVGESADVTIDALPNKTFHGSVTEVGTQAVLRSSGLASTQSTTGNQEAKDFKVVVKLENPPAGLRPGLRRPQKSLLRPRKMSSRIPIQALVIRTKKDLEEAAKASGHDSNSITLAAGRPISGDAELGSTLSSSAKNPEIQGVFDIKNGKAEFVPVTTGIMGSTDIEVMSGLDADNQIITGNYSTLRTLKPYARVKIDNSLPKEPGDK